MYRTSGLYFVMIPESSTTHPSLSTSLDPMQLSGVPRAALQLQQCSAYRKNDRIPIHKIAFSPYHASPSATPKDSVFSCRKWIRTGKEGCVRGSEFGKTAAGGGTEGGREREREVDGVSARSQNQCKRTPARTCALQALQRGTTRQEYVPHNNKPPTKHQHASIAPARRHRRQLAPGPPTNSCPPAPRERHMHVCVCVHDTGTTRHTQPHTVAPPAGGSRPRSLLLLAHPPHRSPFSTQPSQRPSEPRTQLPPPPLTDTSCYTPSSITNA
jgi:hypothetical protein